jgi:hypothetical protein
MAGGWHWPDSEAALEVGNLERLGVAALMRLTAALKQELVSEKTGLRVPRKIAVGQKNATGRSFSANESHEPVSVHNWIFRGALIIICG